MYTENTRLKDAHRRIGDGLILEIELSQTLFLDVGVGQIDDGGEDEKEDYAEGDGGIAIEFLHMVG